MTACADTVFDGTPIYRRLLCLGGCDSVITQRVLGPYRTHCQRCARRARDTARRDATRPVRLCVGGCGAEMPDREPGRPGRTKVRCEACRAKAGLERGRAKRRREDPGLLTAFDPRTCARAACAATFTPRVKSQKWCSKECHHADAKTQWKQRYNADPAFRIREAERRRAEVSTPEGWLQRRLRNGRTRARELGREFTITEADVVLVERCPILGVKLRYGCSDGGGDGPSLDRVDNDKGYVPGNVRVISRRANTMKNNLTAADLRTLLAYVEGRL